MYEACSAPLPPRAGLCSFAYRYAAGIPGFSPRSPLDVFGFIEEAHALGYRRAQICENIGLASLSRQELDRLCRISRELNVELEIGFKRIDEGNIARHMEIARITGASFIRAVTHDRENLSDSERRETVGRAVALLKSWSARFRDLDVLFALENHFDLGTDDLVEIVGEVASPSVGLVFDTTNGLGFLEPPAVTMEKMADHIFSVHLKDYIVRKAEAGYEIVGTALGEGLLRARKIVEFLAGRRPMTTFILEMAIRRNPGWDADTVVQWERDAIRKSTEMMKTILGEPVPAGTHRKQEIAIAKKY